MLEGIGVWAPVSVEGKNPHVLVISENEVLVVSVINLDNTLIDSIGTGEDCSSKESSHF